jgi:hypothetical protein
MSQGLDLGAVLLRRMAQAMKPDEGARPVQVRMLGTPAVVQHSNAIKQLVKQPNGTLVCIP